MSAEAVQAALMAAATAHRPTSGMQVSSGVTCVCGYWTGSEPQGPIPGGWNQLLPHMMREAVAAARPAIERGAKAASVRASVLQGHLDALRKVLFEDAATDHDMRLRKAHAVIRQVEKMEPFENAYASLRAERDALAARLAAVEALADEWEAGARQGNNEWSACLLAAVPELRAALTTGTDPMSTKLGWCVTGHHRKCWHTVGGDHPNYPLITCGCPCHQENE